MQFKPRDWKRTPRNRVDPNKLSRYTIGNDKYDREDFQRLLEEMIDFNANREKLTDSKAGELGYDVWADLYWAFWKVDPESLPSTDIRPSHRVNEVVMEEAQDLSDFKELRMWTIGDDIGSALACTTIEEDVETLYDRLEEAAKQANELDQVMAALAAAEGEAKDAQEQWDQWIEGGGDAEGREAVDWNEKAKELQDKIDQLRKEMEEKGQSLEEALEKARPEMRSTLRNAMRKANDEQEAMNSAAESWGLEPGQLHRLPAQERIELAKKMNNKKFKRIAQLFGPMKRLAFTEQRRKVNYAHEEIYDIELGDDIPRILPQELAKIGDPLQRLLFFKDFYERHIPQYQMRGYEKIAKGGIIYLHDGSGSMGGEREIWAKAVGLALLHIARKQKRSFYAVQFGSPGQIRVDDFRDTAAVSPDQVIDFAEFFFGGGTDFQSPLRHALEILQGEHERFGAVKADIVFATDGMCGISDDFMENFKKEQKRLGFAVWGINIGGNVQDEPLYSICDGKVASITSLVNGENIREIFGNL